MDDELQDLPLGTVRQLADGTRERRIRVIGGAGVWAYYVGASNDAIADIYCNPQSAQLVGRLREAYSGNAPQELWCVVEGYPDPPRERRIYIEDEDAGLPRMEHRDGDSQKEG